MNSAQRRKTYRAMPASGMKIITQYGRELTVIGFMNDGLCAFREERGNVPSLHRVKVAWPTGATARPLLSSIRRA